MSFHHNQYLTRQLSKNIAGLLCNGHMRYLKDLHSHQYYENKEEANYDTKSFKFLDLYLHRRNAVEVYTHLQIMRKYRRIFQTMISFILAPSPNLQGKFEVWVWCWIWVVRQDCHVRPSNSCASVLFPLAVVNQNTGVPGTIWTIQFPSG